MYQGFSAQLLCQEPAVNLVFIAKHRATEQSQLMCQTVGLSRASLYEWLGVTSSREKAVIDGHNPSDRDILSKLHQKTITRTFC
jgi:hypothetical protein